jgi:pilus assembly protein CpaF
MSFGRRQGGTVVPLIPQAPVPSAPVPGSTTAEPPRAPAPKPEFPLAAPPAADPQEPALRAAAASEEAADQAPAAKPEKPASLDEVVERVLPVVHKTIELSEVTRVTRGNLAMQISDIVGQVCRDGELSLEDHERRKVTTTVVNRVLAEAKRHVHGGSAAANAPVERPGNRNVVEDTKQRIQPILLERIDVSKAVTLPPDDLARQIGEIAGEILNEEKLQLNLAEQRDLVTALLNDMLGLGPLEALLADDAVTDIMVNGPKQVYVERRGKLELTDVTFRDDAHLLGICTRIVTRVGRRVDETTPLCDARLKDGSRVNIIIPPLALDGPSISIRKFAKQKITLDVMERTNNLSAEMGAVLKIASRARLNILISGGTGSGKTTLLNALSRMIDPGERVVTIEDAAELQLQQPHVLRLETRPANLEGQGEITQRDLVKNALRMRPDRIILGEIRAGEALDMLQAMNTGHDGSMATIHANRPREALTRLENMVAMTGVKLPHDAVRAQIAGAINMIVQIARMRDGVRRIIYITEVVGMEGEIITTQDLFTYEYQGEDDNGKLIGRFRGSGLRPHFAERAEYFGLGRTLIEAVSKASE